MRLYLWFVLPVMTFAFQHRYTPRNVRQEKYMDILRKPSFSLIIAEGPAGTGKTAMACQTALEMLHHKRIKKIVLTRPITPADDGLGYLKGGLDEKMAPWISPMMDVFQEFYPKTKLKQMIDTGIIEIAPISFLRGRTFKSSFIIGDEIQNATPTQTKLLLTRLGEDSRMVLTGDITQSDLNRPNGMNDLICRLDQKLPQHAAYQEGIAIVRFNSEHIERHPLLTVIHDLYI